MISRVLIVVSTMLLVGCSTLDTGMSQYETGDYHGAFASFSACANDGDPECIGSVGVMYLEGTAPGGTDVEKGLDYVYLAARYGLPEAQKILIEHGQEVPYPDLQAQYEAKLAAEQAEINAAAATLGCALGGGTNCGTGNATSQTPSYQSTPRSYAPADSSAAPKAYAPADSTCINDYQCGVGQKCVKPQNSYSGGRCVTPVSKYGVQDYRYKPASPGVKEVEGCRFDTDCPVLFECKKRPGELNGLCLKRN